MSIKHQGYAINCDNPMCEAKHLEIKGITTERTAIAHARASGWFVGRIRVTHGAPKRHPARSLVLCKWCAYWFARLRLKAAA